MSYILDALKKADADREREAAVVPDLYAQADAERGARAAARAPAWVLPAGALGVVALATVSWWWMRTAPDDPAPAASVTQAPTPAPMPMPKPMPMPAPVTAAAMTPPALQPAVPAAPPPMQVALPPPTPAPAFMAAPAPRPAPARAPAAAPTAAAAAVPDPAPARAPVNAPTAPTPVAAGKPTPQAPQGAETRLPTLAELPADLRSQLPALSVGGSMYSPAAASRMVVLNGQVFREGDKPVDGLAIEQIRLKSTVLVFRGVRFELSH